MLLLLTEAEFSGLMPDHTEEHSSGSDIHPSMNLQASIHEDRTAGLSTAEPNSQTSHSTFPHCPKERKLQSMSWDTPVKCQNAVGKVASKTMNCDEHITHIVIKTTTAKLAKFVDMRKEYLANKFGEFISMYLNGATRNSVLQIVS